MAINLEGYTRDFSTATMGMLENEQAMLLDRINECNTVATWHQTEATLAVMSHEKDADMHVAMRERAKAKAAAYQEALDEVDAEVNKRTKTHRLNKAVIAAERAVSEADDRVTLAQAGLASWPGLGQTDVDCWASAKEELMEALTEAHTTRCDLLLAKQDFVIWDREINPL